MGRLHWFGVHCQELVDVLESRQRAAELGHQRKTLATANEHHRGTGQVGLLFHTISKSVKKNQESYSTALAIQYMYQSIDFLSAPL